MYKIYINENVLQLKDATDIVSQKKTKGVLLAPYNGNTKMLLSYIDMMEKTDRFEEITIYHTNLKKLWKDFKSLLKIVKAGGGIVKNEKRELLFIYRRGSWDLPKGKMDPGEKKKQTAVREVEEETGVTQLKLSSKIITTHHLYRLKNKERALKKTYWYAMTAPNQPLTPQSKEGIKKAEWKNPKKFLNKDIEIYNSILDVIDSYMAITSPNVLQSVD